MPNHNASFFEQLLSKSINRQQFSSISEWHQHFLKITEQRTSTLEQATLGGRFSNNMNFAFCAGYQSAIQSLFKPDARALASLCITEKEGNHPKHIKSTLVEHKQAWQLNGSKSFITGANDATKLYIAVTEPFLIQNNTSRPNIKMLAVPADTTGIHITPMPPLLFVPGISHGTAVFEHVNIQASQILNGDGYSQYVKPFRTHEDIHVLVAILGFRIGEALSSNWSLSSIEAHLMLLSSLLSIRTDSFNEPTTHLIFSGCRAQFNTLIKQTDEEFKLNNPKGFSDWKRDKALLGIASKAHTVRTHRAWEYISGSSS